MIPGGRVSDWHVVSAQKRSSVVTIVTGHRVVGREHWDPTEPGSAFPISSIFWLSDPGQVIDLSGPHCLYLWNGHDTTFFPGVHVD